MTTHALARKHPNLWRLPEPGASEAARSIVKLLGDAYDALRASETIGRLSPLFEELRQTYCDRTHEGWDGYDADPLTLESCEEAAQFLQILPNDIPLPNIVPEPDGGVALEWYVDIERVITISFDGTNTLIYAGLNGAGSHLRGQEPFTDEFPNFLGEYIKELAS